MVSKSTKGEYWKQVKKGMEDAVKAINDAYSFKKDEPDHHDLRGT